MAMIVIQQGVFITVDGSTLHPGIYGTSPDTWLDSANPSDKHGGDTSFFVGRKTFLTQKKRALLWCHIEGVPASHTVWRVDLALTYKSAPLSTLAATLARVTEYDWVELEANWSNYADGLTWGTAGGDYTATDQEKVTLTPAVNPNVFSSYNKVGLPNQLDYAWTNQGNQNFAVILKKDNEKTGDDEFEYYSGEERLTARRPKWTIWTMPRAHGGTLGKTRISNDSSYPVQNRFAIVG